MLEVEYEELVYNQESVSRRIISEIGLEWDDKCLEPHKSKRSVQTASQWQVRQPVYTSSINKWEHYKNHLTPLIEALEKYKTG